MQIKKVTVHELCNAMYARWIAGVDTGIAVASNGSNYGPKGKPKIRFILPDGYVSVLPDGKLRPFLDGYWIPDITREISPLLSQKARIFFGSQIVAPAKNRKCIDFQLAYHYDDIRYVLVRDVCVTSEETRIGYNALVAGALYSEIGKSDYRSKQPTGYVNYLIFPIGYCAATDEVELDVARRQRAHKWRRLAETILGPVAIIP